MKDASNSSATPVVDLLVVGGGVFGLWAAQRGVEAGLSVLVVEKRRTGAGASAGLIGVLGAHTPDRWNEKKAFQLNALAALEGEIDALEAETGAQVGYGRVGKLSPIRSEGFEAQLRERLDGAKRWWAPVDARFTLERREPGYLAHWLAQEASPFGVVEDRLAGRLRPRSYCAALADRLRRRAEIWEETTYLEWKDGAAILERGGGRQRVAAGAVVLAGGWEAFPALRAEIGLDLGGGVKGQSALLKPAAPIDVESPVLYDDGVYVVAHADGHIAVGSTSENRWSTPIEPDTSNTAFLSRAATLCPALNGAEIVSWWAGVRPKCWKRDPLIGAFPAELTRGAPLWGMLGGFKISFGIAHACASALLERITDTEIKTPTPASFSPAHHCEAAVAKSAREQGSGDRP